MVLVKRKIPCITQVLGVKFFPGVNSISESEMNLIENHPGFISEIKCGNMEIIGHEESETTNAVEADTLKEQAAKIAKEVQSMNIDAAKSFILGSGNAYLLNEIKKIDVRKGVQEAVESRLNSIRKQEGSDLTPESKPAPEGTGAEFAAEITGNKEDLEGTKPRTAIPAIKGGK